MNHKKQLTWFSVKLTIGFTLVGNRPSRLERQGEVIGILKMLNLFSCCLGCPSRDINMHMGKDTNLSVHTAW